MRTSLADLWDRLRTSLWFIPTLMAVASIFLAVLLVRAQQWIADDWMLETRWLATGDPDGARQILATIAGSIITVTGVIFSVTIVALSLASQQFGPRLLRNFMRDRSNQFVLGAFIGTFLYSIIVLRVVQDSEDETGIPYLAVTFGVVLAVAALAVLIYFIHHVVVSIQADTVIANVNRELHATFRNLFPDRRDGGDSGEQGAGASGEDDAAECEGVPIQSTKSGYVRAIDQEGLLDAAEKCDVVMRISARPGRFVIDGIAIATVLSRRALDAKARSDIEDATRRGILIGPSRTSGQDIEFSIAQLVEIAVRSLSPSLNDPFTAISCLDRLGEAICELGQRDLPKERRCFRDGRLRLVIHQPDFPGMVNLALDQIRQNARGTPAVVIRMLEVIELVLKRLEDRPECFAPLLEQARMIDRAAEQVVEEPNDREAIKGRFQRVMRWA